MLFILKQLCIKKCLKKAVGLKINTNYNSDTLDGGVDIKWHLRLFLMRFDAVNGTLQDREDGLACVVGDDDGALSDGGGHGEWGSNDHDV